MPRKRGGGKPQWTMGRVIFAGVALMLVGLFIFGGPLQYLYNEFAPEAWREKPAGVTEESELVDLSIKLFHELDRGDPAATPIRVYDAAKVFIESASTSSGVATFKAPYWEGETIYLQIRAAAPNSADYVTYTSPLIEILVPEGDVNGDAELSTIGIWETTTSVATLTITDQDGASISDTTQNYINTTDTSVDVLVSITADCVYGTPEAFTDMDTGKHYLAGVWLRVNCTQPQSINNYDAHFYSQYGHYYIFSIPMVIRDSDFGYTTGRTFSIDTGTSGFSASANFTLDLFDTCWADSLAGISENSFMNGDSDLNPTAVATLVS